MNKVLVLGGYGNFGKRIVQYLSKVEGIEIFIAGRNLNKAEQFRESLNQTARAELHCCEIDINGNSFAEKLEEYSPHLVIHTSGPFQGQNYQVPELCAQKGIHYIDLADDRRFVCDISQLDEVSKTNKVQVVSGASSVPGLSSAVIRHLQHSFIQIDSIDISIAPGNKAERGLATVKGIFSYLGKPFTVFRDGEHKKAYGWMDSRQVDYGDITGKRWLANVDVPDLELFPDYFKVTNRVSFQAGLEIGFLHKTMVAMASAAKKGIISNWQPLAKVSYLLSEVFNRMGSDIGSMRVEVSGLSIQGKALRKQWTLYAPNGNGPYIPILATIILTKKLLAGDRIEGGIKIGATPCCGLLQLQEFKPYFDDLGIYTRVKTIE